MISLELTGLKGNNPIGFLAACGLFRVANQDFESKLSWRRSGGSNGPWTACFSTSCVDTESSLRDRIIEVVADSAKRYLDCLDEYSLTTTEAKVEDYRRIGKEIICRLGNSAGEQTVAEMLSGFGSDLITRKKKDQTVISNSHLLMTSGQQDLLNEKGRKLAKKLTKRQKGGKIASAVREKIEEALFGPWRYEDDEHPLGWDPQMQRLHALRNKEPTNDNKKRSVSVAVYLASQSLPLFPCFAIGGRLHTAGFHYDNSGDWFAWPIWSNPISLDTLRSLLVHPINSDLKQRGVELVFRCRRVRTGSSEKGNYQVFSRAEEWL